MPVSMFRAVTLAPGNDGTCTVLHPPNEPSGNVLRQGNDRQQAYQESEKTGAKGTPANAAVDGSVRSHFRRLALSLGLHNCGLATTNVSLLRGTSDKPVHVCYGKVLDGRSGDPCEKCPNAAEFFAQLPGF